MFEKQISEILKTMVPKNQEELSLLRVLLRCAQILHRQEDGELSLGQLAVASVTVGAHSDVHSFVSRIPADSKKYLYGLVEALDIYQSIYGSTPTAQDITFSDKSVHELKQIRDMCLEDGLRSIY